MEANLRSARKWNDRRLSIRTLEYQESNDSSDPRCHDQIPQPQEICGFRRDHYWSLYHRGCENLNTSNNSSRGQKDLTFPKHSGANYCATSIRSLDSVSNDSMNVDRHHLHPHSLFQGKTVLPQPRSVQLGTASLRADEACSHIPSPRHSFFKTESSSLLDSGMRNHPIQWLSQKINGNNNSSSIYIRCDSFKPSDNPDRTHLDDSTSLESCANVPFFAQSKMDSGVDTYNSEANLRDVVSPLLTANTHAMMSEVNSVSCVFDIMAATVLASQSAQLLPPPPEYGLHIGSQPPLPLVNTHANGVASLAGHLAKSDIRHMTKQRSSLPFLLEDMKIKKNTDSEESSCTSMFKTLDTLDENYHISLAPDKTVGENTKQQMELILNGLDNNDSNNKLHQGATSVNVLTESLKASLIGTIDCFGGTDEELGKPFPNTPVTLKKPNTRFNSQLTCQPKTLDADKSVMTLTMGEPVLDSTITALFLQLTGEGEKNDKAVRSTLHVSSTSTVPRVTENAHGEDPRNIHYTDKKVSFSDIFSKLTQPSVCMVSGSTKCNKGTETRIALSVDGDQSDDPSRPALRQLDLQAKPFRFSREAEPAFESTIMNRRVFESGYCIDAQKHVKPQSFRGPLLPSSSVRDSANFCHNKLVNVGTSSPVWRAAVMTTLGRSQLHNGIVKVQRPPLEVPLVTHQALACIFRETPQSMRLRKKISEKRLKVRPLLHREDWPPTTGADVDRLLKQHKAIKLLRHLTIISFSRQHIKGLQELFNTWVQHGIPAPDMAFGAYYYYVKEKSEKLLCMKHNGRGASPSHGYGKCDFESRRPNNACRYEHVCLFCRSRDHGWFEGDQCEGYQLLLSEIGALDVLEEDVKIMLDAMEKISA